MCGLPENLEGVHQGSPSIRLNTVPAPRPPRQGVSVNHTQLGCAGILMPKDRPISQTSSSKLGWLCNCDQCVSMITYKKTTKTWHRGKIAAVTGMPSETFFLGSPGAPLGGGPTRGLSGARGLT